MQPENWEYKKLLLISFLKTLLIKWKIYVNGSYRKLLCFCFLEVLSPMWRTWSNFSLPQAKIIHHWQLWGVDSTHISILISLWCWVLGDLYIVRLLSLTWGHYDYYVHFLTYWDSYERVSTSISNGNIVLFCFVFLMLYCRKSIPDWRLLNQLFICSLTGGIEDAILYLIIWLQQIIQGIFHYK